MSQKPPSEIAREALKLLAERKLPPTPANYQDCYCEISGHPIMAAFPEKNLRKIALELSAKDAEQRELLDQLDAAISRRSWQDIEKVLPEFFRVVSSSPMVMDAGTAATEDGSATTDTAELFRQIARMIECVLPALENVDELFSRKVESLLRSLRDPAADIRSIQAELGEFSHRLLLAAEEQDAIKIALLDLLHLILENVSTLIVDDRWLKGQVDALLTVVRPPLDLRRLDDVKQRVLNVMDRQSVVRGRSLEAQEEMRVMLAAFIERLSSMNESSTTFQSKIEDSAKRIEEVKTIEDLAPLLKDVIQTTREMAEETARERDALKLLQSQAVATEAEITKLQQELLRASNSARHDPLTNALNRKGLDEALVREIANMRRKETPLSVALLDIDNFKKLNDSLGHESGDAALIHLVNVVRQNLRPGDTLARYGGEEFVILMPDTVQDDGIKAMQRFQRELTKNFFMAGSEHILITFSAGVAQFAPDESGADAIKRADKAMYLAKRAGKNRVLGG
ncbi:MAG: GGDEF domain-containing protein [Gallionella sp.]|jgi:diguanylate cyclase|nr:GGDEF domain-containing protein [Gallionella sp.]MCK9352980.1 GGDEF domain-containing protein [Gallionella sp.]